MANKETKMMSWPQARKLWQLSGVNVHAVTTVTYDKASKLIAEALDGKDIGRKLKMLKGAKVETAPATYDAASPATPRQGLGLRKRTGLDVRPLKLTGGQAANLFKRMQDNPDEVKAVIAELVAAGAEPTDKSRKLLDA
jgi:hypothetical protein